jgi:hypothetical protein
MRQIRQPSLVQIHGRAHGGTVPRADLPGSYDGLPVRSPERVSSQRLIQSAACSAGTRSPTRQQAVGLVFWGKPRKRREQEVEQRLAQAVSLFAPSWAQTLLEGLGRKAIARRTSIRAFRFRAFFRHDLARRRHHQVGSRRWSVFASLPSNTARFWSAARRL